MKGQLSYKRIYDKATPEDGARILVDCLWPRGIKKEEAKLTAWRKEITPSAELRKAYHHKDISYEQFAAAYRMEIEQNKAWPAFVHAVAERLQSGPVTLLTAAKDVARSHIPVLMAALAET